MENKEIFEKINNECSRQDEKWGVRDNHPLEWLAILFEEVGEVAMEVNDAMQQVDSMNLDKYETELIQCGAEITQMLKNLPLYRKHQEDRWFNESQEKVNDEY